MFEKFWKSIFQQIIKHLQISCISQVKPSKVICRIGNARFFIKNIIGSSNEWLRVNILWKVIYIFSKYSYENFLQILSFGMVEEGSNQV